MSKEKFTKGKWSVSVESGNAKVYYPHGFLTSAGVIKIYDSRLDGESWIEMRERTESAREAAKAESNANMHLIAAAPEMYDLLNSIENDDGKIPAFLWDKIQSALAKARGDD